MKMGCYLLGSKPSMMPMQKNIDWRTGNTKLLDDPFSFIYRRLIGKIIYLNITWPNNTYALSQFMENPKQSHLDVAFKLLRYLKQSPSQGIMVFKNIPIKLIAYHASQPKDKLQDMQFFRRNSNLMEIKETKCYV